MTLDLAHVTAPDAAMFHGDPLCAGARGGEP